MIERQELQALVNLTPEHKVLSVYLDTDLSNQPKETVRLIFRDRIKRLAEEPPEAQRIARYLDLSYDWSSRGLAIFASGDELWKVIPLPAAVASQALYTQRPYVRPLYDVLDRYADYSVALIDNETLRMFSVSWGAIVPESTDAGEELKHHRQDGWYAAGYQRYEDNLILHNLKQAAEIMEAYCARRDCHRLMLAGSEGVRSQLKELASRPLLDRIIGEFVVDADAPLDQILEQSLQVAWQADRAEEGAMVAQALDQAAQGGTGVIGTVDTLYALHQGRVRTLLAEETFRLSGYVCDNCGYVWAEDHAACPMCKYTEISASPDVVNVAIDKALETGAEVNFVRANQELLKAGGMAALLRY